jgi:hypothetical protein
MSHDDTPGRDAAHAAREAAQDETPQEWARGDHPHPDEPRYEPREGEAAAAAEQAEARDP